jgi:hypothetical protein
MPMARRGRDAAGGSTSGSTTLLQRALFGIGALLIPLGIAVIVLGWWGASRSPYQYDQMTYLASGGILGLGLTFAGGFLYFGAWLARIASDQRDSDETLAGSFLLLSEMVSRHFGDSPDVLRLVTTAGGDVVHRRECDLVAGREDLRIVDESVPDLSHCRICGGGA